MNKFAKQIVYNCNNIDKFFISPYVDVEIGDEGIIVERSDEGKFVMLGSNNKNAMLHILNDLKMGLTFSELKEEVEIELKEADALSWIQSLYQKGIIE